MQRRRVAQEVRERVLDRIRAALAEGDEAKAMRVARELDRRWKARRPVRARASDVFRPDSRSGVGS